MKTEELRIGNYFFDRGGKLLQLHFWDGPGKLAMNNVVGGVTFHPYTEYAEYANPVPITEGWLLKFGFGKSDDEECGHNTDKHFAFYYDWHFKRFRLEVDDDVNVVDVHLDVHYVHQLQNLYFALTGVEL